jgi:hypothetical protein
MFRIHEKVLGNHGAKKCTPLCARGLAVIAALYTLTWVGTHMAFVNKWTMLKTEIESQLT